MKWFGPSWGAPLCTKSKGTLTPIDRVCLGCDKQIKLGDQGVIMPYVGNPGDPEDAVYHIDCLLQAIGIKPPTDAVSKK